MCTSPPKVNKIVDTTGAGDAFLGGLIVGRYLTNGFHILSLHTLHTYNISVVLVWQ